MDSKATHDTVPLNGFRACLNLWIMYFHSLCIFSSFMPKPAVQALWEALLPVANGYLAVDGFFVLTGYLFALPLVSGGASPGWSVYVTGRVTRIVLPLLGLVLLHCFVVNPCGTHDMVVVRLHSSLAGVLRFFPGVSRAPNGCALAPAALMHVQMFQPMNGTFVHTWSVAVQFHAYLWMYFLWQRLRLHSPGAALRVCLCVSVLAATCRAVAQWHAAGFPDGIVMSMLEMFNYSNALNRIHVIFWGIMAAHVSVDAPRHTWLAGPALTARCVRALCWVAVGVYLYVNMNWKHIAGEARFVRAWYHTLFVTCLSVGTPLSAFVWSWILLAVRHRIGWVCSRIVSPILELPSLGFLAELSYWAYLLHMLVFGRLYSDPYLLYPPSTEPPIDACLVAPGEHPFPTGDWRHAGLSAWCRLRSAIAPPGQEMTVSAWFVHSTIAIVVVYVLSYVLLTFVEQPARRVLSRGFTRLPALVTAVEWYCGAVMLLGAAVHIAVTPAVYTLLNAEHAHELDRKFPEPDLSNFTRRLP